MHDDGATHLGRPVVQQVDRLMAYEIDQEGAIAANATPVPQCHLIYAQHARHGRSFVEHGWAAAGHLCEAVDVMQIKWLRSTITAGAWGY